MIRTATGLHPTPEDAIEAARTARTARTDWLGLEATIRALLHSDDHAAVVLIDEALEAFTGRGRELP